MKKIFLFVLCIVAILPLCLSCTKTDSSIKSVESIQIYTSDGKKNVTGSTIEVNQDFNPQYFTVKFTPSDASDKTFTVDATGGFSVVNVIVASPVECVFYVSFEGNGTSTVTVTTNDGSKKANVTFKVSGR